MKQKVYCGKCKHYRRPRNCWNDSNFVLVEDSDRSYERRPIVYLRQERYACDINANNDCAWYEPSLWTRLKEWFQR